MVAVNSEVAEEAFTSIKVDYEERPSVFDPFGELKVHFCRLVRAEVSSLVALIPL